MKSNIISPSLSSGAFNCPNCSVFSRQSWYFMSGAEQKSGYGLLYQNQAFMISSCENCNFPTIWHGEKIVYPINSMYEPPNQDMPDDIKRDYEEAREIANLSTRGAAALLRLAIQKLCAHLGQPGKNINNDIKELVAKGLPPKVQEALDVVRVIGNDAVHPGTIDLRDDFKTVTTLFKLVNFITQKMITEPREIDEIYGRLPGDKLDG
ncbi:hypothetical protein AK95_16380 [Paenibacillus sp. LC231]|uniref:DUF4145 domain-containing protein n=1 Tax=Paenibacillus sp. LC231 TaxID=1120679 RepID=UPI0008DD2E26|nr:DUF4145 domain-containing protein [Paenibacillus sp. LC231]OIA98735.1 hypothetical protein AK95_16380 [Paenibacillus sp. LC231]